MRSFFHTQNKYCNFVVLSKLEFRNYQLVSKLVGLGEQQFRSVFRSMCCGFVFSSAVELPTFLWQSSSNLLPFSLTFYTILSSASSARVSRHRIREQKCSTSIVCLLVSYRNTLSQYLRTPPSVPALPMPTNNIHCTRLPKVSLDLCTRDMISYLRMLILGESGLLLQSRWQRLQNRSWRYSWVIDLSQACSQARSFVCREWENLDMDRWKSMMFYIVDVLRNNYYTLCYNFFHRVGS